MPISDKYYLDKRVETVLHSLRANWTRVTTVLRVWGRGDEDRPRVRRYIDDLDVLIRLSDGKRFHAPQADASQGAQDAWAARAAACVAAGDSQRVYIDCHEKQVEALQNGSCKTLALLGGNRAGKSHFLAWWLFRQWLIRGRRGAQFWWVAPTLPKAKIGVKKLIKGEGAGKDPVFPAMFVGYCPARIVAGNQTVRLLDGSELVFHHANADGDNLKGEKVEAVAFDEITSVKDELNWTIGRARTLETGGPVAVGSTPKAGHWVRERIIIRALHSSEIHYVEVDCWANPWVPIDEIWRLVAEEAGLEPEEVESVRMLPADQQAEAAKKLIDSPLVLREYFGSWAADDLMAYGAFDVERHVRFGAKDATRQGFTPVTNQAFSRDHYWQDFDTLGEFVGGQDFNINPMTTVVAEVVMLPSGQWGLWVMDEVQTRGTIDSHAIRLSKRYRGLPLACDPTGCRGGTPDVQRSADAPTHHHYLRSAGFPATPAWVKAGKARNIDTVKCLLMMNWLFRNGRILIHERCRELIRGLQLAEATAAGGTMKIPGTRSATDIASACPDALRYLAWRIFGPEFRELLESKHESLAA